MDPENSAIRDFDRYQDLHSIIMLREVIRKWWGLELAFADGGGYVAQHATGTIIPSDNEFCRLSLFSKEGFRRCNQSVKYVADRFRASKKPRRSTFHDCHMGFSIVACPVVGDDETYRGFLFTGGFVRQTLSPADGARVKSGIRALNPEATDLDTALRGVPELSTEEIEKLCDLLEFGADEIAAYEKGESESHSRIEALEHALEDRYRFESIVGTSAPMQNVFSLLEKVCRSDSTVLINGESGTGKELVARAIHYNGPRRDGAFVVQNCSAFNDNLLESALFGHVKGAFTGAMKDTKGLFEVADGGTFFLDELGDMSPALQVKLLRVLQEGTFTPVGGTQTRQVDVRVIAATHKDLARMVEEGSFREDLYYRINVIKVDIPALRERRDDIPMLIEHFLGRHADQGNTTRLSPACMRVLLEYDWPGNIRELENEIERLMVLGAGETDVGPELISGRIRDQVGEPMPQTGRARPSGSLKNAVEELEREMIHQGLIRTHWNKSRLARELGISRSNLIAKCDKYGLEAPQS